MSHLPSSSASSDSGTPRRSPLASAAAGGAGFGKPRVRMLATEGDVTPAGATYTPPTAAPLPARGAGVHLVLSGIAAIASLVFLLLSLQKL